MSDAPGGPNIEGEAPVVEDVVETEEATITEESELERTLGLTGGLAIGIWTMIGAGIFVFPGLAVAEVGTAASASFAVGGVIALLVALPTSELATATPESGGGISSSPGASGRWRAQWSTSRCGSASCLRRRSTWSGWATTPSTLSRSSASASPPAPATRLRAPVLFGVAFTVLKITGTENAAKLQNGIVVLLLSMLIVFLAFGVLDVLGIVGTRATGGTEPTARPRCRSSRRRRSCSRPTSTSRRSRPSPAR